MSYPLDFACHFIGVGGVIIHNNKVLLVKLTYGRARGMFLIPGGLVEKGEILEEGLIREIKEETGLDIHPSKIIGIRSMVRERDHLTDLYTIFTCDLISSPDSIHKDNLEIEELKWIEIKDLGREDVLEYTRIIVKKALSANGMTQDPQLTQSAKKRLNLEKYSQFWI
ncbi:MAG: NUDIX domain-containing protein [Candidatus Thorarchaeota archaeon]